jgi:hypothetical protein
VLGWQKNHQRTNFSDKTPKNNQYLNHAKKFNHIRDLLPIPIAMRSEA